MGDPTDQVGTLDTTGLTGGGPPDIETIMTSPELLEPHEEGEEVPISLAESKAAAEEEASGESFSEEGEGEGETPDEEDAPEVEPQVAPEPEVEPEEAPEGDGADEGGAEDGEGEGAAGFDPGEHTVAEVVDFVEAHPDQRESILAAERAGKNRSTLVNTLSG